MTGRSTRVVILVAVLAGCSGGGGLGVGGSGGQGGGGAGGTAGIGGTGGQDGGMRCGNGQLDPGERCDPAIPQGQSGACPQSCDDKDPCTVDQMTGSAGDCSADCTHQAITTCGPQDGCCAQGCSAGTDPDCSASCGDGVVEADAGENCDKGIPAGQPGACPTSCDDGNPCTTQALVGTAENCTARCVYRDVTACGPNDDCCPQNCNATTDPDCMPSCGNGIVEMGETCDKAIPAGQTGACPTSCADMNACTRDRLMGDSATCSAYCTHTPITTCGSNEGCCPAGCNANNDPNCQAVCGNGVLEPGESCDTGIAAGQPGACPTGCDDGNSCTNDTLSGSGCSAQCVHDTISACGPNDGCCPPGCGAGQDPNCQNAVCGNGVVETGERCDTAIAAGQPGACPQSAADCNDGNACTNDSVSGSGCQAVCAHAAVTTCSLASDGCCPGGCNATNDADCSPRCGNGVVEAGETCDPPSSCPTLSQCNDGDACTTDFLVGSATNCTAQCGHSAVTTCSFTSDGCCPSNCNFNTDIDCGAVCGNGIVEGSERCDTGIPFGQPGSCPTSCPPPCQSPSDCPSFDETCVNNMCVPIDGPGNRTCNPDVLVGTACQAHCVGQTTTSCGGPSSDMCCPFGCSASSDGDCNGSWAPSTLQAGVAFTTTCTNIPVTLQAGHSYVVTTCVAAGTALSGNGDTVLEVRDPSGNLLVTDDDCLTVPNLIDSAGWSCDNGNADPFASCAGETPGGFLAPVSGTYNVCVRAFSSSSTGTATVSLWQN